MPTDKDRTGQRAIAHRPKKLTARTCQRPFRRAHAGCDLASPHALEPDRLVFHHMIEQHPMLGAERRHRAGPPGRQAVGIQGNTQSLGQAIFVQRRDLPLQVPLEQAHLLHMVEQSLTQLGRPGRRIAQQHRLADARLE